MDPAASDELFGARVPVVRRLSDWVRELGGALDAGSSDGVVRRVVSPLHAAHPDDLVFVASPRHLRHVKRADDAGSVVLCQSLLAARCPVRRRWVHDHALWVVTRLVSSPPGSFEATEPSIAPTARIAEGADVHPTADVRAGAVILAGARIGPFSTIGENAVVYGRTRLGARVSVGPLAVIGKPGFGWTTSPLGEVVRVPQLGGVLVEDDVEIGAHATIDAGTLGPTIVRRGVKLDAHVHVAHNVEIGEGTFVAAQSGFAGSAVVGRGVLIGGQVGVTDHAQIGNGARVGAKSGVIGDVPQGATVAGFPAVPRIEWLRAWARLLGSSARKRRLR